MVSNVSAARVLFGLLIGTATATAVAGPAVIELYTSEGCSSCPPAEKLIEELAKRSDVLPVAFHVDYWDGLGWRDRFALREATQRQEQAARILRLSTVGTPEIIVDGRTVIWGAGRAAVDQALKSGRTAREIQIERNSEELILRPQRAESSEPFDVYVVGYLPKAVTAIRGGENAGRTLTEVNIVRSIQRIGRSDSAREWHFSLGELPADAQCLVVLLQEQNGAIVGAKAIGRSPHQSCTPVTAP